jgi:hypothetical protein
VADYERTVQSLTTPQIEARVDALIRESGVSVLGDPSLARAACATDEGVPHSRAGLQPAFVMRWQGSELTRLPQVLLDRLNSGRYRRASVGSCPAQGLEGTFSAYRVAVLLY